MDIASLGIKIDSSQATKAASDLDKLTASGKATEAGANSASKAFNSLAAGQKLSTYQAQQLSFQLNDLFVQMSSGQSPVTALIQQGSQLNGTFGGFGGTLRAVSTLFTVTRVAVGGLVGVFAGLAYALIEGRNQSAEFAKAVALTGNAAGITEGQFNSLAQSISRSTNTTIGSSREALQSLVASGRFSGDALNETAKATQLLSKVTGQSTDDVVKSFIGMTDGVAKFAETTNRSYHFLTAEQLKYIKSLEDQGDQQKAIELTMQALNVRLGDSAKNVGLLESAWGGLKQAASSALDAMLSIGRVQTPEDKIRNLAAAIKLLDESQSRNPQDARLRADFVAQLEAQRAIVKVQQESAQAEAKGIEKQQAKTAFNKLIEQSLTRQQKLTKELADANALADKSGASQAERASVLAGIREKFKDLDLGKPTLGLDIEKLKAALSVLTDSYKNAESILEATRAAGLLDEKTYYDAKRGFINLNRDAAVKELEQENILLKSAKANARESLENQKKIAENQGKIDELKNEAAAKGIVLGIQQKSAVDQVTRSYEEARLAAQDYLDTLTRQQGRDLDAFGMGDKERNRLAARQQIEDRYTQQRLELENNKRLLELEGKFTDQSRQQYETRLGIINEFQAKALDSWDKHYAAIGKKEDDWSTGASRALQNYYDESRNISRQTQDLFTRAFQGMEDALVEFTKTGKLNFKSLADSIMDDLLRIIIKQQITGPASQALQGGMSSGDGIGGLIGSLFGTLFGSGSSSGGGMPDFMRGGRAIGGPVSAGGVYPVNERGRPELLTVAGKQYLMMGSQSGQVDSNPGTSGQRPIQVSITQSFAPGTDRRTTNQAAVQAGQVLQRSLARNS